MNEQMLALLKNNAAPLAILLASIMAFSATFGMSPMEFVNWLLGLSTAAYVRLLSLLALFFVCLFVAWRREPKGKEDEKPVVDQPPVA